MGKRYLRIDMEYEDDHVEVQGARYAFRVSDNIKQLLAEVMPYCRIVFVRDAPTRDLLNESGPRP